MVHICACIHTRYHEPVLCCAHERAACAGIQVRGPCLCACQKEEGKREYPFFAACSDAGGEVSIFD